MIFYGALISACRPPEAWPAGLQLYLDASALGLSSAQLLGAAVACCARAERWPQALALFAQGGERNAVMATALLRHAPAERVEELLVAVEDMKVRLDTIAYNAARKGDSEWEEVAMDACTS